MNFDAWKKRLEVEASKFDDPERADQAALEEGAAYYAGFMGTVIDFLNEVNVSHMPEHRKIEIAVGFLRSLVDSMTAACMAFTRRYSEEAEEIIEWHQNHIEFFKGLISELEEAR